MNILAADLKHAFRMLRQSPGFTAAAVSTFSGSGWESGHTPSHLTILVGCEGGIHMIADSDWPLDSLQAHHGATMAYRVSQAHEKVRVEGREGCMFESPAAPSAARLILGGVRNHMLMLAPAM